MIANDIHRIIEKRTRLDSHDAYGTKECWNEEMQVLTNNIEDTLCFFEYECSIEDFFWLSEVFSDVSEVLQSKDFIDILRKRLSKVTRESYIQGNLDDEFMVQNISYSDYVDAIIMEIDYAEGALND